MSKSTRTAFLAAVLLGSLLLLTGCGEPSYVRQLREESAEYQKQATGQIDQLTARIQSLEAKVSQLKAPPTPPTPAGEKPVVEEQQPAKETAAQPTSPSVKPKVQKAEAVGPTVYITRTGKKYHGGSCRYLRQSKIAISLSGAKARGYTPCKVCRPPG